MVYCKKKKNILFNLVGQHLGHEPNPIIYL